MRGRVSLRQVVDRPHGEEVDGWRDPRGRRTGLLHRPSVIAGSRKLKSGVRVTDQETIEGCKECGKSLSTDAEIPGEQDPDRSLPRFAVRRPALDVDARWKDQGPSAEM